MWKNMSRGGYQGKCASDLGPLGAQRKEFRPSDVHVDGQRAPLAIHTNGGLQASTPESEATGQSQNVQSRGDGKTKGDGKSVGPGGKKDKSKQRPCGSRGKGKQGPRTDPP